MVLRDRGIAGGEVGNRSNRDLLADLYYILLMSDIWLEGCNG